MAEERPDLEEAKNALIINSAKMKQELKEIEDNILSRLSNTEGNPVDDVDLINALQASKAKSQEIQVRPAKINYHDLLPKLTKLLALASNWNSINDSQYFYLWFIGSDPLIKGFCFDDACYLSLHYESLHFIIISFKLLWDPVK